MRTAFPHWKSLNETNLFRHPEPRSSFRRRSSAVDFPPVSTRRSSLAFKKNEQVNTDDSRRMSLLDLKANGELNKNLKNLVVRVCLFLYESDLLTCKFVSMITSVIRLWLIYNQNNRHLNNWAIWKVVMKVWINYDLQVSVIGHRKVNRRNHEIRVNLG